MVEMKEGGEEVIALVTSNNPNWTVPYRIVNYWPEENTLPARLVESGRQRDFFTIKQVKLKITNDNYETLVEIRY